MSETSGADASLNPYMRIIQLQGALLEYAVRHDPLTGALNKDALKSDIQDAMTAGIPLGLGLLDLDNFKAVNDELGHEEGDKILIGLADYFRSHLRRPGEEFAFERNFVTAPNNQTSEVPLSRLGGDEFAIYFQLKDRGQQSDRSKSDGLKPYERAMKYFAYYNRLCKGFVDMQPEEVKKLGLDISAGFAVFDPSKPITVSELFKQSDSRMYYVKKDRKASRA